MDQAKLRAWWAHRQGLDGSLVGSAPEEVLKRSGWARSVAGIGPYLTLYSRAGISREAADKAVANLKIHELPSARGCTYVIPASDFALALKVGQAFAEAPMKTARRLGVTDKEVDRLCEAVVNALDKLKVPSGPEDIRAATGNAARSLGEEGKKKGLTTTLPLALGKLQAEGEIRRVPINGRLDQQRYSYVLWRPNPLKGYKHSEAEAYTQLAKHFFAWIAPATLGEFQWFSGLGVAASKAAIAPLKLVPAEKDSDRLMFEGDRAKFAAFKPPTKPHYFLVSSLDAIHTLRRDVVGLLEPRDMSHKAFGGAFQQKGGISDLPNHAIVDRGRLVGLWEYDPEAEKIVAATFGVKDKALDSAIKATETYIREQVGDARSFSMDTPKSRLPRMQTLKKAAGR